MAGNRTGLFAILTILFFFAVGPLFDDSLLISPVQQDRVFSIFTESSSALDNFSCPIRWFPDLCLGQGSPYPIYESPYFYVLPYLLTKLSLNAVTAIKLAISLLMIISLSGMYFLVARFFSPWFGVFAAALYLYAPFRIAQIRIYGDLGGYAAGAILPWITILILKTKNKSAIRPSLVVLTGFLGILDVTGFILIVILCGFTLVRSIKNIAFRSIFLSLILGLCLSATFWLPCMFERNSIRLGHDELRDLNPSQHLLYPNQWISYTWGRGISREGPDDEAPFQIGIISLILLFASISGFYINKTTDRFWILTSVILFIFILFLTSHYSSILWNNPLLKMINYPWRLIWIAVFFAILGGIPSLSYFSQNGDHAPIISIAGILCVLFLYGGLFTSPGDPAIDLSLYQPKVICQRGSDQDWIYDFVPASTKYPANRIPFRMNVVNGDATVSKYVRDTPFVMEFLTTGMENSVIATNIFNFPTWQITVDNRQTPAQIDKEDQTIRFGIPGGDHRVIIRQKRTNLQKFADLLTLTGLIILGIVFFLNRKNSEKNADGS